jgi:N-acetylneuraminate synthase
LEAKKPKGYGIDAADYESVIGRELNKSLIAWEFLNHKDIK